MVKEKISERLKRKIRKAERQIERGEVTIVDTKMSCEEIDKLLMKD